ncbi:asparagine synthase-related protein [Albimonas pacifica]|uniref:asparagine synthase (glutamine-hydrolyzing) n=1 Tax=Albimonas pacifica TaxID=1114924 RepID=A0A1I3NQ76_9RHOB|nr:asparagine synthase-related protein [Albimonas pacifica]SFJ10916.1 Glutamine amidotransferase domain-containing protein [Albimonas pacifica]
MSSEAPAASAAAAPPGPCGTMPAARFFGVFDPRGRADRLDALHRAMASAFADPGWTGADLDGAGAGGDPAARVLRLSVRLPAGLPGATGDPSAWLRRGPGGRIWTGLARIWTPPRPASVEETRPLPAPLRDLDRVASAEAAGRFDELHSAAQAVEGDYALAICDPQVPRLTLLRDAIGAEPLVYARLADGAVAFANWTHALLAIPEVGREPDAQALTDIFACNRPAHGRTAWRGVDEAPAAHVLRVDDRGLRLAPHWTPGPDPALRGLGDDDVVELMLERARLAVDSRWRGLGRSPALLFSGGLDSSLIAALVCTGAGADEVAPAWSSRASSGAEPAERASRLALAARYPGLALHETFSDDADPLDGAEQAWRRMAEPCADAGAGTRFALHGAALAAGADAMLGGFGGDYVISHVLPNYLHDRLRAGAWSEAAAEMRRMRALGSRRRQVLRRALWASSPLASRWRMRRGDGLGESQFGPAPDLATRRRWHAQGHRPWEVGAGSIAEEFRVRMRGRHTWMLCDLHFWDGPATGVAAPPRAVQAYGSPLFDTRVLSAAMAAPPRLQRRGGQVRGLIRAMLERVAPPEVARRPDKSPFQPDAAIMAAARRPILAAGFAEAARHPLWPALVDVARLEADLAALDRGAPAERNARAGGVLRAWFLAEFLRRAAEAP